VRAYLQVACAGLGFDIGEVWWTSNENGSSTVAAIGGWMQRVGEFKGFGCRRHASHGLSEAIAKDQEEEGPSIATCSCSAVAL
jgi:hypothetical protein